MVAPHLAGAHLGSAEEEAHEWLLNDTQQQMMYLAERHEARWHLSAQWSRYNAPLEYTQEDLAHLLAGLPHGAELPDWHGRLAEAVRESRANYRLMMAWLDARAAAQS